MVGMIGKRLAHFEIVGKLGEGGMGVVYEAIDHHLDRRVALKILPSEKVSDWVLYTRLDSQVNDLMLVDNFH
jgi:serine/threonine protein kinase